MAELRFCAYQYQHSSLDALQLRWLDAEGLGFDVLWNCDTVVEPDRHRHVMFDGPATLTMMATGTSAIRVGTLVSSLYFRHPVTLAKAVMTVDHLSGGRVEVALGVGDPSAGARAAGVDARHARADCTRVRTTRDAVSTANLTRCARRETTVRPTSRTAWAQPRLWVVIDGCIYNNGLAVSGQTAADPAVATLPIAPPIHSRDPTASSRRPGRIHPRSCRVAQPLSTRRRPRNSAQ